MRMAVRRIPRSGSLRLPLRRRSLRHRPRRGRVDGRPAPRSRSAIHGDRSGHEHDASHADDASDGTWRRQRASSPSDTGASDIANLGAGGWKVQSSATATQSGAQISAPGFDTTTWLPVANDDAGAPGTEIEALAQNGRCPEDTAPAAGHPGLQRPEQRLLLQQHAACATAS